ncbi:MAG: hypothetical protein PF483_14995 [Halothiobacillus sp.]|nr:hypothetical protein [Halothiobacillus sp.]
MRDHNEPFFISTTFTRDPNFDTWEKQPMRSVLPLRFGLKEEGSVYQSGIRHLREARTTPTIEPVF